MIKATYLFHPWAIRIANLIFQNFWFFSSSKFRAARHDRDVFEIACFQQITHSSWTLLTLVLFHPSIHIPHSRPISIDLGSLIFITPLLDHSASLMAPVLSFASIFALFNCSWSSLSFSLSKFRFNWFGVILCGISSHFWARNLCHLGSQLPSTPWCVFPLNYGCCEYALQKRICQHIQLLRK